MKDLVKIIEQESYEYKDPITGELTSNGLAQVPSEESLHLLGA